MATWTNPAGRAAGSLTFTPHNQQIVGDKIYLSHYHGGVYVLDASAAFAGQRERPRELGFIVPYSEPTRPLLGQPVLTGVYERFFTDFPLGRPEIWDAVYYKGYVLAADMTGGFYSLHYGRRDAAAAATPPPRSRASSAASRASSAAACAYAAGCATAAAPAPSACRSRWRARSAAAAPSCAGTAASRAPARCRRAST